MFIRTLPHDFATDEVDGWRESGHTIETLYEYMEIQVLAVEHINRVEGEHYIKVYEYLPDGVCNIYRFDTHESFQDFAKKKNWGN